jgi:hypothetical protein
MFRPHTAIFMCYSILSRSWCSVMPFFPMPWCQPCAPADSLLIVSVLEYLCCLCGLHVACLLLSVLFLSALFIFGCVVVPSVFVFMCAVAVGVLCKFRVVCQRWGYWGLCLYHLAVDCACWLCVCSISLMYWGVFLSFLLLLILTPGCLLLVMWLVWRGTSMLYKAA